MISLTIAVIAIVILYLYSTKTFDYWKKRGIKHDKPIPFLGNAARNFFMQLSITQLATEMYQKYSKEKIVGLFYTTIPVMVVRDPEIAKRILTTDFAYFYPRGLNYHKDVIEPLFRNLFFADGDLWRLLRQRMTPAFSSGKLKAMFPLVCARAERLQMMLDTATNDGAKILDARDIMARYTTDFIGSVGFGLNVDSLTDANSTFRQIGYKIFNFSTFEFFVGVCKDLFPNILKHARLMFQVERDLVPLVREILKQRNYKPSGRNDFIDLLLECKMKGTIVCESIEKIKPDGSGETVEMELTDELIAAQVFVFFAAGFETSSSATSYTLHQLAYNPETQKKVQEEIDRVLNKYNNKLCYDAVKEMTYLECAFKEAMRKFPSLGFLLRQCAREYTIPELGITIDPKVAVWIPVQALHNDPEYFENPEEFRPERFLEKEFEAIHKLVYMPFGDGPRACIGTRLGMMQSIVGLAAVLSKFTVEPSPNTLRHPVVEPKSTIVQVIKNGIPLTFHRRTKNIADN